MNGPWLTELHLNPSDRQVIRDISDVQEMHKTVMRVVGDGIGESARQHAGVLWRLDSRTRQQRLYVQTEREPDLTRLPDGWTTQTRTTSLARALSLIEDGTTIRFCCRANPTRRNPRTRKRVAVPEAERDSWFIEAAGRRGLDVTDLTVSRSERVRGRKDGNTVVHAVSDFEGVAVVTDCQQATRTLQEGFGRGRAHGCGLMLFVPVVHTSS